MFVQLAAVAMPQSGRHVPGVDSGRPDLDGAPVAARHPAEQA
jgi:hypothetical protein